MGTTPCIETGHRRNGLYFLNTASTRLSRAGGYGGLAVAALLIAIGVARAQTSPPGQAQIAKSAATAPISIAVVIGQTPVTIPESSVFTDASGAMTTFLPGGPVSTSASPFFDTTITANGRSCFTCHIPPGWTISPPQINSLYASSSGKSPLFQPIDSANCPDTPNATGPAGAKFIAAHSQLFNHGNFRIAINAPNPFDPYPNVSTFEGNTPSAFNTSMANPQWIMTVLKDPTGCENDPTYGLPAGLVSVYRRTMPSANVAFLNPGARGPLLSNIMWDAREPSLESQFVDATEFHGQASNPAILHPSDPTEGAEFQQGIFAAQTNDSIGGDLTGGDGSGATGGPVNLFDEHLNVPPGGFFPPGSCFAPETLEGFDFCPGIFGIPFADTEFSSFANAAGKNAGQIARRKSIARGETIFNTRQFTINDVAGLNDAVGVCQTPPNCPRLTPGTCSTCHNNENVGNDSFLDPKRTGIMDNSNNTNNALPPTSDYPLFAFYCPSGSIPYFTNSVTSSYCQDLPGSPTTCDEFITTDPGEGLADGECEDLGKFKVPVLHGVAARAPYFHGGNVATLTDLVNFYNNRFNIGLSAQDKTDLVNFLNAL
jgi:cytochrome c peroxidase